MAGKLDFLKKMVSHPVVKKSAALGAAGAAGGLAIAKGTGRGIQRGAGYVKDIHERISGTGYLIAILFIFVIDLLTGGYGGWDPWPFIKQFELVMLWNPFLAVLLVFVVYNFMIKGDKEETFASLIFSVVLSIFLTTGVWAYSINSLLHIAFILWFGFFYIKKNAESAGSAYITMTILIILDMFGQWIFTSVGILASVHLFQFIPILVIFTIIYINSKESSTFSKILLLALILVIIASVWAQTSTQRTSMLQREEVKGTVLDVLDDISTGFSKIGTGIKKSLQRQITYASTGDYYTGQVDQNAKELLGVYLEDIRLSEPVVYEGETLSIWGTLKARTLEDKIVNVEVSCSTKSRKDKTIKGYTDIEKRSYTRNFEIAKMEEEDIDCVFEKQALDKGTYIISLNAVFDFTTMAYLKDYFINKERLRALTREEIDVFDQYGITDKEPSAIYTNGPVMIGMETTGGSLIGLSEETENKPLLGITLDNGWDGKIKEIKSLILYVPEGIGLSGDCLGSMFEAYNDIKEDEIQQGYSAYKLRDDVKKSPGFKDIEEFKTINCRLDIPQSRVNEVLGNTPITTKYFKVTVDYVYEIEEKISASIVQPEGFSVVIEEGTPTAKDNLHCVGTDSEEKLVSGECSFHRISGNEEMLVKEIKNIPCNDDGCSCVLDKRETNKNDIIRCIIKSKNSDDEEEIGSDSVLIRNSVPEINSIEITKAVVNNNLECKAVVKDYDDKIMQTATYVFEGDYVEQGDAVCKYISTESDGAEKIECTATSKEFYDVVEGYSVSCRMIVGDGQDSSKEKTATAIVRGME